MSQTALETMFRLDGKVIIVTGAAGLLGRKHVEAIAAVGGRPVLLDIDQTAVDALSAELNNKYSTGAVGYAVDITQENCVKQNCQVVLDACGKIDGLVNNAANNPKVENKTDTNFSRLENFSLDMWQDDLAVGLTGAFLCAKHYGAEIAKNPAGGIIVNIASDLALVAPDQRLYQLVGEKADNQPVKPVTYSVVKSGLVGLTRYLSTYWVNQDVRCNAICPGGIENGQGEEFIAQVSSRIPMSRMAKVDEYQGTLLWMLSDASSYLNGAIVPVDGGRTAW